MDRRILISVDSLKETGYFVEHGVQLAKELNMSAVLFNEESVSGRMEVMTTGGVLEVEESGLTSDHAEVKRKMERLVEKYREYWPRVSYLIQQGNFKEELVRIANREMPFMVILKKLSQPGILQDIFGSYESKMVSEINPPVLFLPNKQTRSNIRSVYYVAEPDDAFSKNLRMLDHWLDISQGNLTVGVYEKKRAEYPDFMGQRSDHTATRIFQRDHIHQQLDELIKKNQVDLLAFQSRAQNIFERLFNDKSTTDLILGWNIPVLVF